MEGVLGRGRDKEEEEEEEEEKEEEKEEGGSVKDINEKAEKCIEAEDTGKTQEPQQDDYVIPLAVPSTVAGEMSHPLATARNAKTQESRVDDDEEEEDEDEEEDMLAKESEEGSDSSDSQYASMSESSSTPTTPAGEPSDAHEASAPTQPPSSTSISGDAPGNTSKGEEQEDKGVDSADNSASLDSNMTDSRITDSSITDSMTTESSQASTDAGEGSAAAAAAAPSPADSTSIMQGYVMVPILTPYYDPSVIYGYPVVVADQQQQQQQLHQQQQQQRNYSKRKKKKYQRRRQAESASGGYLDPHLYTGEPFVATPGGYVVPLDPASVCHVHGLPYVPQPFPAHAPLPHQAHDEGFVSVQHSPYLPEAVPPPGGEQAQQAGGTSGDDASKTVFSDLQDTERRQIQEILQDRAKVGKSDSTESSDSGVSESEETAATELSSDELEARERRTSREQGAAAEQGDPAGEETAVASSDACQFQETLKNETCINAQLDLSEVSSSDDTLSATAENTAETVSLTASDDSCPKVAEQCDASGAEELLSQTPVSCEDASDVCRSTQVSAPVTDITDAESCTTLALADSAELESVCASPVSGAESEVTEKEEEKFCGVSTDVDIQSSKISFTESNDIFDSVDAHKIGENHKCSELIEEKDKVTTTEKSLELATEDSADGEVHCKSIAEVSFSNETSDVCVESNVESVCDFLTKGAEANLKCQGEVAVSSEPDIKCSKISAQELEIAQDSPIVPGNTNLCDISVDSRTEGAVNDGGTRESSIDRDSLKDLKVTEAVKRWIREVTPEKAFTLSEEVQSLLLAEQELDDELDTEDEYIEDEISEEAKAIVMDPKNVEGNPFVAASSDALKSDMESCSKRVASCSRSRGTTPETFDEYDGASTISNLSFDRLYSEASSSRPASTNHSFDEEEIEKYSGNPEIYNPVAYAKYYQLGIEVDETTPVATPLPGSGSRTRDATPAAEAHSEAGSDCGSEEVETVPHKYDVAQRHSEASPMSLATEILKAEKLLNNMAHITGTPHEAAAAEERFGNPDIFLKHFRTGLHGEVGDSGVQSEESSDETEARSTVGSSGVGSSLASTPAISPAHHTNGRPPLQPHPLKNLSVGEGPVPCRTVCCAVM